MMTTQPQTQIDLMKRTSKRIFEEGLNVGRVEVFDETHAEDCAWHGPGGRELRGRAAIKEMVGGYMKAFPDMRMTIQHEVAEGNQLATHWRVTGTHEGPLGDTPATGKRIEIDGYIIARFERGKVVEEFEMFDELSMLQQLGLAES
jgi:steroid delta-isomerase-like uncharacterized protein